MHDKAHNPQSDDDCGMDFEDRRGPELKGYHQTFNLKR
jgi:hypothetical protein